MNLNAAQSLGLHYVRIERIFDLVCTNGATKQKFAPLSLLRIVIRTSAARWIIDQWLTKYRNAN